ncbi:8935_t:CDS:2 [Acaulospora morrowiae]|uniref:8935_t:CDS:1 n=1 Tax=Acaulospora morrowiae TaxID=94023 RepID=A0A9N8Z1L4_9GLOM|nr:8935_t:CDS:2 [Acaulospora morrowiae]
MLLHQYKFGLYIDDRPHLNLDASDTIKLSVMSASSSSTQARIEHPSTPSKQETQIIYELRALLHTVDSINQNLFSAVHLTSPGGSLFEAQKRASESLEEFKKLVERRDVNRE